MAKTAFFILHFEMTYLCQHCICIIWV